MSLSRHGNQADEFLKGQSLDAVKQALGMLMKAPSSRPGLQVLKSLVRKFGASD